MQISAFDTPLPCPGTEASDASQHGLEFNLKEVYDRDLRHSFVNGCILGPKASLASLRNDADVAWEESLDAAKRVGGLGSQVSTFSGKIFGRPVPDCRHSCAQALPFATKVHNLGPIWDLWLYDFESALASLCWGRAFLHLTLRRVESADIDEYFYFWLADSRDLRRAVQRRPHRISRWQFSGGPRHFSSGEMLERRNQDCRRGIASQPSAGLYITLARTLAQQGQRGEALRQLDPMHCPFSETGEVHRAWKAILDGRWDP